MLLGDFNLDWLKKDHNNYQFNGYFEIFNEVLCDKNLVQLVNFPTWSRCVNGTLRESLLDHVYASSPTCISNLSSLVPYFGDHVLIYLKYDEAKPEPKKSFKRSWQQYSQSKLVSMMSLLNWEIESDSVQDCWNEIENKLVNIIDILAPIEEFANESSVKSSKTPIFIKKLMNRRKHLLSRLKKGFQQIVKDEIKSIDTKIKDYFRTKKSVNVKRCIIPGNSSSLWRTVKTAKDVNTNSIPSTLYESGIEIENEQVAERFANYFDTKIKNFLQQTSINDNVYNGARKVIAEEKIFMDPTSVRECIASLKIKNTEGYDRIPQRVLVDGIDVLIRPFSILFKKIFYQNSIPGQCLISKNYSSF